MGHKGVSKRKPKKSGSNNKNSIHGSTNVRPVESSSVQSLVSTKDAPGDRGSTTLSPESKKKRRR
jgi:hypothetical protein